MQPSLSSSRNSRLSRYAQFTKGEPWFDDGNIVLLSTNDKTHVAFKLHRGVLGRHSEVFQSMFSIPQPSSGHDDELFEGCQAVNTFGDDPTLLSHFLKALYDGVTFHSRNTEDFFFLAGVLQLAHKYFVNHLRRQAITYLTQTWAHTLSGIDAMVLNALKKAPDQSDSNALTFPFVHPIHVYHLARQVEARVLMPSAMYFLSLYPFNDLLRGDHPKLLVCPNHPARPSSTLTADEVETYTLVFQHRLTLLINFIKSCEFPDTNDKCLTPGEQGPCMKGHRRLGSRLHRSWSIRTAPLQFMSQAVSEMNADPMVCSSCRKLFRERVTTLREQVWNDLPGVMGLPPWEELVKDLE